MISPLPTVFLVTLTSIALGGFTSNAFITTVIAIEWAKSGTLNSSELLLLSICISNICCTASVTTVAYREHFNWKNYSMSEVSSYIFLCIAVLSRFWFNAWLCVFYCIKIVNSTHSLFLWCKNRISGLLPWILVASAAISILFSVFAVQRVPARIQSNTTTINITDMVRDVGRIKILPFYHIVFLVIGSGCPLLVVLLCSIVTVAFLFRHICQMKGIESSFRSPQTHSKAVGTVLFLVVLYLSFFLVQILPLITATEDKKIVFCVYCVVLLVYSLVQPAILVLVNTRLKQALTRMLPGRKP